MTIYRGRDAIALLSGELSEDVSTVVCPSCGSHYTHIHSVGTLVGSDQFEAVVAYKGTASSGTTPARRSAVEIVFDCEGCPHLFALVIQQQKGNNLVEVHQKDESTVRDPVSHTANEEEVPNIGGHEGTSAARSDPSNFLATTSQQLNDAGVFDPSGISDAREHVLSSIVRRRGQPAFRQRLLSAYNGRCAITGCGLECVLDAAHIIPYMGPETNHPCNGLLLRTDLHTLFDLKLVAIDAITMNLLISSSLKGTCYEEYRGRLIVLPDDPLSWPSREALEHHRKESGL